ncbi:hypothetical protein D3C75_930900 [compost metagenome]
MRRSGDSSSRDETVVVPRGRKSSLSLIFTSTLSTTLSPRSTSATPGAFGEPSSPDRPSLLKKSISIISVFWSKLREFASRFATRERPSPPSVEVIAITFSGS